MNQLCHLFWREERARAGLRWGKSEVPGPQREHDRAGLGGGRVEAQLYLLVVL